MPATGLALFVLASRRCCCSSRPPPRRRASRWLGGRDRDVAVLVMVAAGLLLLMVRDAS